MPDFHFYHPIEIRYGDLDPQGHVNNAAYLTYMEQARLKYYEHLGLFKGNDFLRLGFLKPRAPIRPILYGTDPRGLHGPLATRVPDGIRYRRSRRYDDGDQDNSGCDYRSASIPSRHSGARPNEFEGSEL
jgi:hypothetical protein